MRIFTGDGYNPLIHKTADLLARQIKLRAGVRPGILAQGRPRAGDITLAVQGELLSESFEIEIGPEPSARVVGGDPRGVLYGGGRLLRAARFEPGRIIFGPSEGPCVPDMALRGIYFATHFGNFYHHAPVPEVVRYVEELALWGVNFLVVWFDMHHFTGLDDPAARKHLERLRALQHAAHGVGMRFGLVTLANEAYSTSPVELRADPNTGRAHYHVELCPSKPAALERIVRDLRAEFEQFDPLDAIWIWPYDQGGCACEACRPWGANGFLRAARAVAAMFRGLGGGGKVFLSTWLFDFAKDEEWRGFYRELEKDHSWIDGVIADGPNAFPHWPLEHRLPGDLPLLNFAEISMHDMYPWGGCGINPRPRHWQEMWDLLRPHVRGGWPYSEGIYEDINKVIWAQLFWNGRRSVRDIMTEYAAWEFSPEQAGKIFSIMERMEITLTRFKLKVQGLEGASKIWEEICSIDASLPPWAKSAWRWRIVYLRALIDAELEKNRLKPTAAVKTALKEIARIYHARRAEEAVNPAAALKP